MRLTVTSVLAIASTVAPDTAWADWEYTHWGMTPEQVASASNGAVQVLPGAKRQAIPALKRESGADGTLTSDALKLDLIFQFDTESRGLVCVLARASDAGQNDAYRAWMIEKHGQPQEKQGLAVIGQEVLVWNTKDDIRFEVTEGSAAHAMHCRPGDGM